MIKINSKTTDTLTHTEILTLALRSIIADCDKAYDAIKTAQDDQLKGMLNTVYESTFWKASKLLELYKLETGNDYGCDSEWMEDMK